MNLLRKELELYLRGGGQFRVRHWRDVLVRAINEQSKKPNACALGTRMCDSENAAAMHVLDQLQAERITPDEICIILLHGTYRTFYEYAVYGQLLNVCGEKTSENTFNLALEETVARMKDMALVDYTTAENRTLDDVTNAPKNERYYILFLEVEGNGRLSLTEEEKNTFDEELQVYNENYKELRAEGRIKKMKVIQTKPGSFLELKQWILSKNPRTSSIQFKTPRVLRSAEQLEFMMTTALEN